MEEAYLSLPNMTSSVDGSQDLSSTIQTIKYSLLVLVYLCIRDVVKYAVPLIKVFIAEKLKAA
jgi:hypothetical protein